jgi:DNA-binding response OmpR family regulator
MTPTATILVADDNRLYAALLETLLQSADYHVTLVADGTALLASVRDAPPDLIVTDLAMPLLDGIDAIEQLRTRSETATIPIIAISARADLEAPARAAGADTFLLKPFPLDELLARIAALLASRQQPFLAHLR